MKSSKKASRQQIFVHLIHLLGDRAEEIAICSAEWIMSGRKQDGITLLTQYDEALGGTGIYLVTDSKLRGIYRALTYVKMPLHAPHPEHFTRSMVVSACAYLEELLKKIAWLLPWEEINPEFPLGKLVNRAKNRFSPPLFEELTWLSKNVYNCAKHDFNLEQEGEEEPQHFFSLDETIAVYLICRKLGLEIESMVDPKKLASW